MGMNSKRQMVAVMVTLLVAILVILLVAILTKLASLLVALMALSASNFPHPPFHMWQLLHTGGSGVDLKASHSLLT